MEVEVSGGGGGRASGLKESCDDDYEVVYLSCCVWSY